jgi:hypothetical protein
VIVADIGSQSLTRQEFFGVKLITNGCICARLAGIYTARTL